MSKLTVTVARGELKRGGKWYGPGQTLEITQAEFDAMPHLYALPGAVDPEIAQVEQQKQAQDAADKADKQRRLEADRLRREQLAEANLKALREQEQLAAAGVARQKRRSVAPVQG